MMEEEEGRGKEELARMPEIDYVFKIVVVEDSRWEGRRFSGGSPGTSSSSTPSPPSDSSFRPPTYHHQLQAHEGSDMGH